METETAASSSDVPSFVAMSDLSPEYKRRAEADWSRIAGEPVTVVRIGGTIMYGFCSELGVLRLYLAFRGHARVSHRENYGWAFSPLQIGEKP